MATEYLSWWPTSSWMSPGAALFLLCNVLIGAIVVTSRGEQRGRAAAASTRRLCRSASSMVLDRLRSFSMFSAVHVLVEEDYHHPSLELQGEDQQPPTVAEEPAICTAPASKPVAAAAASATSGSAMEVAGAGEDKPVNSEEAQCPAWQGHTHQQAPSSTAVDAAGGEPATTAAADRPAETISESIVQRARACRREVEEALEGKVALNARAELFIRQFREDLKLQRLNSIINYTRALRRGAGGE